MGLKDGQPIPFDAQFERTFRPPLPVRFEDPDVLLPDALDYYRAALPADLRYNYEKALHDQWRMRGLRDEGIPVSLWAESDLQHTVTGMRKIKDDLLNPKYSILQNSIDPVTAQILFGIHDAGEAADLIGDVPKRNRTRRDQARKRLEPRAAVDGVFAQIPDPHYRDEVTGLYLQYISKDKTFLEGHFVRWTDRMIGAQVIAEVTQPLLYDDEIRDRMRIHFLETLPDAIDSILPLMTYLPTVEQREAFAALVQDNISQIEAFGHEEAVHAFRQKLDGAA